MSIKSINQNSEFIIKAHARSRLYPHIRVQKQKTLKGKQVSLSRAKQLEKQLQHQCYEELKRKENADITFRELVDKWYNFKYHSGEVTKETCNDYLKALEKWSYLILDKPCNEIFISDVKAILNIQKDHGISRSFRRKFKSMINNVFNYGIEEGYLNQTTKSPTVGIKLERNEEKKPEILTLKQTRKFLESAKLLGNGELYALEKGDIDLENNKIIISKSYNNRRDEFKTTKAGYYRTVPINNELKNLILELMNNNPESKFILPRLKGWKKGRQAEVLRSFLSGIGLPSVKFHTLRACFATLLLQQSIAPVIVMKVCGWRDLKTMERYIRLSGLDESGVTDSLRLLPNNELADVISLNAN